MVDMLLVGVKDVLKKLYNVYKDSNKGKVATSDFSTNIKKNTEKATNVVDTNQDLTVKEWRQ